MYDDRGDLRDALNSLNDALPMAVQWRVKAPMGACETLVWAGSDRAMGRCKM